MAFTNSSMVSFIKISPNRNSHRTHAIDTITIHCMAGNASIEACGNLFAKSGTAASSNYGVGTDGRVGMYVEEADRSWCSSNWQNDDRAVTIEVANDGGAPDWHVSDKALQSTILLCADICRRNNIHALKWSDAKNERVNHLNGCNMTVHRDYANKACPGDYLMGKMAYIARQVNLLLDANAVPAPQEEKVLYRVQMGAFKARENADGQLRLLQAIGQNGIIIFSKGLYKVQLGAFAVKGNAENLAEKMRTAGYDCFITTEQGTMMATYNKSVDDLALEVISGAWGSGDERVRRLTDAGYDAQAVQARVNELW